MNRSVLIVLSLALVGCQTPPTPPPTKLVSLSSVFRLAKLEEIDSAIGQAIAAGKAPGAVVRIESSRAVYQKTFGDKSAKPERSPMTADTIFDAASLTKVIATAPAIALLIEQGKMGLDDRVEKW
ncbi:MAG: serine hydrolase domain-containing protein, partial [Limisphaerales bacterium]